MRRPQVLIVWAACCSSPALFGRFAAAQDTGKTECASAYESAQEHRASGQLLAAREALVVCAQQTCPAFVQSDCAQWLTEVEREMPSVVIAAKDASGNDTTDVKVIVDDRLVFEQLDGRAIDIDPGAHSFKFEHGELPSITRRVVVRQGHKNRMVEVSFAPELPPAPDSLEPAAPIDVAPPAPGPLRPYAYVAGGVGAAGILTGGLFWILGSSQQSDLEETCAPNCAESKANEVKAKYLIGDIAMGVGIAGLAAGVALFFMSQPASENPDLVTGVTLDLAPVRSGGFASVRSRF